MEILDNSEFGSENNSSGLTNKMKDYLVETAKWAKFLAIISFIGIGFLVLLSIIMAVTLSGITNESAAAPFHGKYITALSISGMYLLFAVLGIFPALYLLRFSKGILKNVSSFDHTATEHALLNLKSLFKFHGIITIGILVFYMLFILFFALGGQKMLIN